MLVHAFGWLFCGLALCGAGYAILVSRFVDRFGTGTGATQPSSAAVTLLKPLHFDEPGLRANLETFLDQDYGAPVQIVFGVQNANDPAIAIVESLCKERPDADIALVIDPTAHGSNGKVSNLINMMPRAKHGVLVMSDSDIVVARDWLARVVSALEQPGVGVVTCLYGGVPRGNFWSVIAAMGASYEFLPNVIASVSLGMAEPCLGSTIALRRSVLESIGGLRAFANKLADDYEIGRAVREKGLSIAIPAFAVGHTSPETSWADHFRHEIRWNRTTRAIAPAGHLGSAITHAVPLAVLGAVLTGFSVYALATFAVALGARLWLKGRVARKFATYAGPALVLPVRDMISFGVFLASFFGESVHWRGGRFQVSPGGALSSHEVS